MTNMLQLKEAFKELVPKHFKFLEKHHKFIFQGIQFDKDYQFLFAADYSSEDMIIHVTFDEREGYLAIILSLRDFPEKKNSMSRLMKLINPNYFFELKVTGKKLDLYKEMFKVKIDENKLKSKVGQFIFNEKDLNDFLKYYAQALKNNYEVIIEKLLTL